MYEKQQISTLKNTITQIQQQNLTDLDALREANSDLYDSLWIAMYDFASLALLAKSHTNRKGERKPGNAALLASVRLTPDDVSAALLTHLYSKLDKIVVKPVDEIIPYTNTTVYRFCLDIVRRKKPDPLSLDQPIGPDGTTTLGELLADELSDFVAEMVDNDTHQEELEAARDVVLRLIGLMDAKPGVASALLSRLMGRKPLEMVADIRKNGALRTINHYIHSVCKTLSISVPAVQKETCSIKDLEQQLHVMMMKKPNNTIAVLTHITGLKPQALAASIRKDGVDHTIGQCCSMIRSKLITGSRDEQAALRGKVRWAMTNLQLHTYDTDTECAKHISKLCNRHKGLLAPCMTA